MKCIECGKETTNPKFCSQKCFGRYNRRNNCNLIRPQKQRKSQCLNCGNEVNRKSNQYCSNACQVEYQYKAYIERWHKGLENGLTGGYGISNHLLRYVREKYNNKCARCGWDKINPYTGNVPLEVDHIDGNYKNNNEDNLILQCPNCHSLTATYKGANKGHGRTARSKYYENKNKQ